MDVAKGPVGEEVHTLYDALPSRHIRLLSILPDGPNGEVCCQLLPRSLDTQPRYTALSYAWGAPSSHRKIILNGESYTVYENLWRFLNQARKLGSRFGGWLWIDALCINQSDNKDKEQQIVLMPDIYQSADLVMIWLGPNYGESDRAMRVLKKPTSYWQAKNNILGVWGKPAGMAIRGICSRRYWGRLWIFQEIMLGQNVEVMCGAMIIPLDSLKGFLLLVHEQQPSSRVAAKTEYQLIRHSPAWEIIKQMKDQHDRTLWGLMMGTSSLACVQKLDYIYALLGIATKGKDDIVPDYKASIPVLLNTILKNQHELQAPKSLEEVADQCRKLERTLGIDEDSMYVLEGHDEFMQTFIDAEWDEFTLCLGRTRISFWWGVYYGHHVVQSLLCSYGVIPFETLGQAAKRGNAVLLKLLLDVNGHDVDRKDDSGYAPLHYAAENGHDHVVEMLLKLRGINVNLREGSTGMTSFQLAVLKGHEKVAARILATSKFELKERDCESLLLIATSHSDAAGLVKLLLDTGKMDINACTDSGETALHSAARNNDLATVELLLGTSQIEVSEPNEIGDTPLHLATENRNVAIAKLLLDHGADFRITPGVVLRDTVTPGGGYGRSITFSPDIPGYETKGSILQLALQDGTGEKGRFLLDAGVDIDALAPDAITAKRVDRIIPPVGPFYPGTRLPWME
ncbi:heterokaryon incompatibility -domain-containing protein [Rutstroemia sp. NJR-2017a WRK4]|nr:heterokaryon incompatibility -domain-containing protein [Rutstroemia sp. NJR-2017a WRK4]